MRVLFVSGIDGFCHRYQVLHRAAQLEVLGAVTTIRHFTDPRLRDDVAAHDLLFLYRVPETAQVRALLAHAGDLGLPRIAAIDDLIFVDEPAYLPSLDHLAEDERALWRAGVRRYRATIELCDAFLAPTEPLVRIGDALGWRSYLHRNALAPAELELGRRARAVARARRSPLLGYLSGTPTHDEDFASISRALRDVLRAHPEARLLLVGPVALPAELEPLAGSIERRGLVAWHELPALLAEVDVCLAPLFADQWFASAKGEVKYLEAAAVSVPTVATATSAYRHAICDGDNGRLATTQDEWRRALDELLRDPALRRRLGAAAQADVAARYSESRRAGDLLAIVEDVRGGLRRRSRSTAPAVLPVATAEERPARVALEPDACPAFRTAVAAATAPPVPGGSRLVQRLRAACDGLVRVDVHAVTFGQPLAQRISLELRRDDGTIAGRAVLPAAEMPDRAWLALDLDAPEQRSGGRTYALEIAVDGVRGGSAPAFAVADGSAAAEGDECGALGSAELDGTPIAAVLVLRGFADWHTVLASGHESADSKPPGAPRVNGHGGAASVVSFAGAGALRA